jgi:hypothetical protein
MQDLKRIRFVTTNYAYIQGLKWVPYGVWILLLVAVLQIRWRSPLMTLALILLTAVVVVATLLIQRYYNRAFGQTRPALTYRLWEWGLGGVGGALAVVAIWLDLTRPLPVNLIGLTCAAAIVCDYVRLNWYAKGWYRGYALVMAFLLTVASGLPLLGMPMRPTLLVVLMVMGVTLVVLGILDHRLLMGAMKPVPEVADGQPL